MASPVPEVARICIRGLSRPAKQARSFSTTVRRRKNGPISVFPPTPNAELDGVLTTLRTNVFVPAHLKEPQQHLVYRKYWQRYLTGEEPISVSLPTNDPTNRDASAEESTESFTLQPLDKLRDEPSHVATFNKVLDLLRTTPDSWFNILPGYLRELHVVGRVVKPDQVEKLIRRATESGKLGLVLQCLRRVEDLGVKVSNSAIARRLVYSAHQRAAKAGFGLGSEGDEVATLEECQKELERAIKNVEATMLLIQDRRHVPIESRDDPKQCPELYGAAMALVAVRRLLSVRENSPERVAARRQRQAAEASQVDASKEGASGASEEAAAASEDAQTSDNAEQSVIFAPRESDHQHLEAYATRMLELSEHANLNFNAESSREVCDFLKRWLPVWFGVQVAEKALPASSTLKSRLRAAFDADIRPEVIAAVGVLDRYSVGHAERELYAAYRKFLSSL